MPASTRKSAGPKTSQSRLTDAFKSSGTKITKPSSAHAAKDLESHKKAESVTLTRSSPPPAVEIKQEPVELSDEEDVLQEENTLPSSVDAVKSEIKSELEALVAKADEEEEEEDVSEYAETVIRRPVVLPLEVKEDQVKLASKVSKKEIKSHYDAQAATKKAPTFHQESLTMHEKILRYFDESKEYGPDIGISRFSRWNRAQRLGLQPPVTVLAVLLQEGLGEGTQAEKGTKAGEVKSGSMSYVNDLLVAKVE